MNIAIISNFRDYMKESTNITTLELAKELIKLKNTVVIIAKKKKSSPVTGIRNILII